MGRPNPYSPEVEAAIVQGYASGASMHELRRTHGGSRETIRNRLQAAGVLLRTREERQHRIPIREDAFADAEHDEEAAYWVGMLMADGCVYRHGASTMYVHLGLHTSDEEHLEAYKRFLASTHQIVRTAQMRDSVKGRLPVCVTMSEIRIGSKRLAADLAKYGVVPKKSKTAKVIGLESNRHFWRGVVDGDGNLRWSTNRNLPNQFPRPCLQLVGSEPLMRQFQEYAKKLVGSGTVAHKTKSCWGFTLFSNKAIGMIAHLYNDCPTALARKWSKAHEILCQWSMRPASRRLAFPVASNSVPDRVELS